jgi:hypothetical protein
MPPDLVVSGGFCLTDTSADQPGCTSDCGGGGTATCDLAPLPDGGYTVKHDTLTVPFTVPSTLPAGGACTGSPF